jgi:hypothetical protein
MSTDPNAGCNTICTLDQQKSFRDRLREAFSNPTEEDRHRAVSIVQVGKMAFITAVQRVIATIGAIEDRLEHEKSNPIWANSAHDFLEQANQTSNAVMFLPVEAVAQSNTAAGDPATELQKAFHKHLGEPFDHHSALDHFEAPSIEEVSKMALVKAVNRVIASIDAIEERLDCEKSNPVWAGLMRAFLEQAKHNLREIEMLHPQPIVQGLRYGG